MRKFAVLCLILSFAAHAEKPKDRIRLSLNAESGYSDRNYFADENDTLQSGKSPGKIGLLCVAVPLRLKRNEVTVSSGVFPSTYFDQLETFSLIGFSEVAYQYDFGPKFKAGVTTGGSAFWYNGDYLFGEASAKLNLKAYLNQSVFGVLTAGGGRQLYGEDYTFQNSLFASSRFTLYLYMLGRKLILLPYAEIMLNDAKDYSTTSGTGTEFISYSFSRYRGGFRATYAFPKRISASGGYSLENRVYWNPSTFWQTSGFVTQREINWAHNGTMELSWTFLSSLSVTALYQRTLQTSSLSEFSRYSYKGYAADRFGLRLSYAKAIL